MSKPKWANIHLTLEQALNVLDIDRQLNVSYASDKRGAIRIIRKALEEKGAIKTKQPKNQFFIIYYYTHHSFGDMKSHCTSNNPFVSKRLKLRLENQAVYKCEIKDLRTGKIIYSGNSWEEIAKLGEKYENRT